MAEPYQIICAGACQLTVYHDLMLPPLQLTVEDGGKIALAILAVWVVGWAVRMVIRALAAGSPGRDVDND